MNIEAKLMDDVRLRSRDGEKRKNRKRFFDYINTILFFSICEKNIFYLLSNYNYNIAPSLIPRTERAKPPIPWAEADSELNSSPRGCAG